MVGISGRGTCSNFFFCYFGARAPAGRTRTGLASRGREGRLGQNGFLSFANLYHLTLHNPKCQNTEERVDDNDGDDDHEDNEAEADAEAPATGVPATTADGGEDDYGMDEEDDNNNGNEEEEGGAMQEDDY